MFVRNFIELSAAVHELSCKQRNRKEKKLSDDAEKQYCLLSRRLVPRTFIFPFSLAAVDLRLL